MCHFILMQTMTPCSPSQNKICNVEEEALAMMGLRGTSLHPDHLQKPFLQPFYSLGPC